MSRPDPRLRVLAALLAQGRAVHLTACALALGAWVLGGGPVLAGLVAVALGIETWFAVRVGLDAALFDGLGSGVDARDVDGGLLGLGLIAQAPGRPVGSRVRGAVRLWRWQLVWTGVLGGLLAAGLVVRGLG